MPDRIVRDELLESDRWLDLPSDTDRLAFIGLLLRCDDFGNLEATPRRIARHLRSFTQVKTDDNVATCLAHLIDADLIRGYSSGGREFWHIPRFRSHRQYLSRRCPASPWDAEGQLGKDRRVIARGLAKDQAHRTKVDATSQRHEGDKAEGVGVGVGVAGLSTYGVDPARESAGDNSGDNSTSRPEVNKPTADPTPPRPTGQWWKTDDGIKRMAEALRIPCAPGWSYRQIKARCFEALEAQTTDPP